MAGHPSALIASLSTEARGIRLEIFSTGDDVSELGGHLADPLVIPRRLSRTTRHSHYRVLFRDCYVSRLRSRPTPPARPLRGETGPVWSPLSQRHPTGPVTLLTG